MGVVELAGAKNCLSSDISLKKCLPPYCSTPPDFGLASKDVEEIADASGGKEIFRSASSEWGDFGKYSIPGRVRPFLTANLNEPTPISADERKAGFYDEIIAPSPDLVAALVAYEALRSDPVNWILRITVADEPEDPETEKRAQEVAKILNDAREQVEGFLSAAEITRFSHEYLREGTDRSQYENVDIQQCRLWITKRAYELGWTEEMFPNDGRGTYGSRHESDLERIGKKYQRIALDELQARLDLSRNCAAPLIAYYALKEKRDGITTHHRI